MILYYNNVLQYYDLREPPSYMRSDVERNVVIRRTAYLRTKPQAIKSHKHVIGTLILIQYNTRYHICSGYEYSHSATGRQPIPTLHCSYTDVVQPA
jgi:hypothetical protein